MTAPDLSSRGPRRTFPAADLVLLGLSVGALLFVAHEGFWTWRTARDARDQVTAARREVEALGAESRTLAPPTRTADQVLAAQALRTLHAPPPRVLADLASVLPPDVRLDGVAIAYAPRLQVELQVVARSPQAYDRFVRALTESPLFGDVVPGDESREGELRATVAVAYRGAP